MIDLPVAEAWFVRQRVDDAVTLVTEPHVHRLLRCNVWHVRGRDRDLVIDTALGLAPLRQFVERQLESGGRAGQRSGSINDSPLLAVATHSHGDHIGGLHEFPQRAIHRAEADDLLDPFGTTLDADVFGESVVGPYRAAGYDIPDLLIDAVPAGPPIAAAVDVAPAPATQLLEEGDVIDLGDSAFEVLHLPGHSPGSIGLWDAASGVLFSGDAVYDGPLLDEIDGACIEDYLATMRRLRELPVTVVHGGHESSFGRDRLVEICDSYLRHRCPGAALG